jgi:NAD(P) transhydrogenase subunit alpha
MRPNMIVGVLKETYPGERRVALVPAVVPALRKAGLEVLLEAGAGGAAGFPDAEYVDKGARLAAARDEIFAAEVLACVRAAGANPDAGRADWSRYRPGQTVVGLCDPLGEPQAVAAVAPTGVVLFALELLPRITRAQSMDVLSSQATVAGYRAVILAAAALPQMFPMLMTAAGTITPARVLVLGAGVAGLQAIATARRLGGVVSGYDVRPTVKEQVESLGARFLELPLETAGAEEQSGYAKAMDESFYRRQRELLSRAVAEHHVVISTAMVPGKRAPILITAEMVSRMLPGSVIVDLAAERGGNCELTRPGEVIVEHGVAIVAAANLASDVPHDASQMYARNMTAFLTHWFAHGGSRPDADDPILRDTRLTGEGTLVHARVRELLAAEGAPSAEPA